jgi:hypothetical protein
MQARLLSPLPILPHHQCNHGLEEVSYLGEQFFDPSQARSNLHSSCGWLHLLRVSLAQLPQNKHLICCPIRTLFLIPSRLLNRITD